MKRLYRRTQYNDKPFWNSDQLEPLLDQDGMVPWPEDFLGYNGRTPTTSSKRLPTRSEPPPQNSLTPLEERTLYMGWWIRFRYRKLAAESGVATVARRLRKQGWPLHITLMVLL